MLCMISWSLGVKEGLRLTKCASNITGFSTMICANSLFLSSVHCKCQPKIQYTTPPHDIPPNNQSSPCLPHSVYILTCVGFEWRFFSALSPMSSLVSWGWELETQARGLGCTARIVVDGEDIGGKVIDAVSFDF